MKSYSNCGDAFAVGAFCSLCKNNLDFDCAQISDASWRKLGSERRAAWKCPTCRSSFSPALTAASAIEPASLESVLKEMRDLKRQLVGLPSIIDDIKFIKAELKDLKTSCDFISRLDDFSVRVVDLEKRVADVELLQKTVTNMKSEMESLNALISSNDQRSRLNNVEIKNVPLKRDENLYTIVEAIGKAANYSFPKSQINYVSRVPLQGSKDKAIVVSFINRYIKEEFAASARACKTLSTSDIGFQGEKRRVYVNDHLNISSKKLLNNAKSLAKEKNYAYVWVKYGKIHIRRNDTFPVLIIGKDSDLNKIA